jgi:ABC transport system ATP-binding/permease protein
MVADYAGTLLLVSHDRAFLDNVVTSTLVFEGAGCIREYVGGYSDAVKQKQARAGSVTARPAKAAAPKSSVKAAASKPRKLSYNERRELDSLPGLIERLEAEQSALQEALSDPALFQKEPARARDAMERCRGIANELEAAYARWEVLESAAVNAASAPDP